MANPIFAVMKVEEKNKRQNKLIRKLIILFFFSFWKRKYILTRVNFKIRTVLFQNNHGSVHNNRSGNLKVDF